MESIAEHVSACLKSFNSLCNASDIWTNAASEEALRNDDADDVSLLRLKNELSRFKVWSGNIGAHRKGRSSLDHRLRDASNIRGQVIELLQDLQESLDDAKDILMGKTTPWDQDPPPLDIGDGDDSNDASDFKIYLAAPSEISQIFAGIIEDVNCLFRLSVSIHNPSPHDRFKKATLTDTSHFEPFDVEHVRTKFTTASTPVVERLGKAISRRRQYFKYREMHHQKLSSGLEDGVVDATQTTVASSLPQKLNLNGPIPLESEDDASDAGRSQTSYATSATNTERRKVPALPPEAENGPFECPLCFMMVSISSRRLWKKHVFSDLLPYICVEQDCPAPDQDFQRRYQWSDHVLKYHWKTWACSLGCTKAFASMGEMKNHLTIVHAATSDSTHINTLLNICERPKSTNDTAECPLCRETLSTLKQYQRHVGRHQEDLALFALPPLPGGEDESGDQTEDDEQAEEEAKAASDEDEVKSIVMMKSDASIQPASRADRFTEEIDREWQAGTQLRHRNLDDSRPLDSARIIRVESPSEGSQLSVTTDDEIYLRYRGIKYTISFRILAIEDGSVLVSHVQDRAAMILEPPRYGRKITLFYEGDKLENPNMPIRDYGVKSGSEVTMDLFDGSQRGRNLLNEKVALDGLGEVADDEDESDRGSILQRKLGRTYDASPAASNDPNGDHDFDDEAQRDLTYRYADPSTQRAIIEEYDSLEARTDTNNDSRLLSKEASTRPRIKKEQGISLPPIPTTAQHLNTSDLLSYDLKYYGLLTYDGTPQSSAPRLAPDRWGNEISFDADWTMINRILVSPEVLERAGVRYEARPDYVAVLGRLTREQITVFARESAECRAARRAACVTCQKARERCDEERPCRRCIRLGYADTCQNGAPEQARDFVNAQAQTCNIM